MSNDAQMTPNGLRSLEPLQLRKMQSEGNTVQIPITPDYKADLFGTAYLAAHHEEPVNTRDARFQSLAILRLAAIVGDIQRPEHRLSYETGLTEPELRAINLLIRHTHAVLSDLVEEKKKGIDFLNLELALSKLKPAAATTHHLRATYVIDYLEWLMKTGDGVLSRYVVPDSDIRMRRQAFESIRQCITKPTKPGRTKRNAFSGYALSMLEEHMGTYIPSAIWKDAVMGLSANRTGFACLSV
ncbi:hypothetical protein [Primorskyibacter sp. 2E233]|uniref:hypothetical protein n=1 Tax=Primorskyibacter sp. 2E233 TaxID=3413431 RepID=UPI003BF42EF9